MADIIDPDERIKALLDQAEVRIARIFNISVQHLRDSLDMEQVAALLEAGRYEELLEQLQATAQHIGTAAQIEFITAGQSVATFLTAADVGLVSFNAVNTRAVSIMAAQTLDLIRGFTADQTFVTHGVLVDGVSRGLNPREMARNFRDVVGLTPTQANAVRNYRALLEKVGEQDATGQRDALSRALRDGRYDRTVESAIRRQQPLTDVQIDRMVTRYSERYVKYRSEVIGRTEAMRAVNEGNQEGYNQAIDSGVLDADQLENKWGTKVDGRERDSHHGLNGVVRPWGRTFPGKYSELRYPGDPQAVSAEVVLCRCHLTTRISLR